MTCVTWLRKEFHKIVLFIVLLSVSFKKKSEQVD